MSGLAQWDEITASVRALGTLSADVAKEAAPLIEASLRKTAAAGTDPDGHAWPEKKGGGRPLVNAASHITASAAGPVVRGVLTGVDVFHHYGAGVPRRQILPDPGVVTEGMAEAVDIALGRVLARRGFS